MLTTATTLLIIERAYRGAVETQFADVLNTVLELHRQSGGVDLALRGLAVTYALECDAQPALRIGGRTLDTLPDPRASLQRLLRAHVAVWVEEAEVRALGDSAPHRLLPGIRRVPGRGLASRWSHYERVWFL